MPTAWKNQYIDLVQEKPEYILAASARSLTPDQIQTIRERAGALPVFCELCCGSGGHLVELAAAHPEGFFIGFELRFKRTFNTAKKAERLGLQNLLIVRTNAKELPRVFSTAELSGVYINFPDPWERERWKKHRVLTPEFIELLADRLKPGGFLSYKTDHEEYFTSTEQILRSHPRFSITKYSRNLHESEFSAGSVKTEFERLFLSKHLPIFFLHAEIVR